jgi:hypothetical protein
MDSVKDQVKRRQSILGPSVTVQTGLCGHAGPCLGPSCNQWDRLAESCGVRSAGEALTLIKTVLGPQIEAMLSGTPEEEPKDGEEAGQSKITE